MSHAHFARRALREMKRAPQATTDSTSSVSSTTPSATGTVNAYAQQIVNSVPHSTVAVVIVLTLLVLIGSGLCIWRYRVRRRKRLARSAESEDVLYRAATNSSFDSEKHAGLEKPQKVFIPIPDKGEAAWTPQIKAYKGVPIANGELPKHVQAAREAQRWNNEPSPPPSYKEKADPVPPAAPINKQLNVDTSDLPKSRFSNPTPFLTAVSETQSELPSPVRTSSFAHQQKQHSRSRSVSSKHISGQITTKITPSQARHSRSGSSTDMTRLMSVINTFHPSLDDELDIRIGDVVRLLEEYHDGWCLVQHTTNPSLRGVVPRFCLVDRQSAPPSKSRKRPLTAQKI